MNCLRQNNFNLLILALPKEIKTQKKLLNVRLKFSTNKDEIFNCCYKSIFVRTLFIHCLKKEINI